jgi:hypothetical protein
MLQILLGSEVKFLVVGAYAMGAHGYPRATGDLDIWVESSPQNSERIYKSLSQFGVPLSDITEITFCQQGIVFQIGLAPRRIDIITKIDGVDFDKAYADKQQIEIEGIKIPFISRQDLIRNKESTGREKDKLDAKYLRQRHDA